MPQIKQKFMSFMALRIGENVEDSQKKDIYLNILD